MDAEKKGPRTYWVESILKIHQIIEAHGYDAIYEDESGKTPEDRVVREPIVVWATVTTKSVQYSSEPRLGTPTGREDDHGQSVRGFVVGEKELEDPTSVQNFKGYARSAETLEVLDSIFSWKKPLTESAAS